MQAHAPSPLYREQKEKSFLSKNTATGCMSGLTEQYLRERFPRLADEGFGISQLEQIEECLSQKGRDSSQVLVGLAHAEWELDHGKMVPSSGEAIVSPINWVFKCFVRDGAQGA